MQWPDDFPDETQRGKTKTVRVTLHEVKRKSAPELDDAFAREVGDFDSLDALKQAVRSDLERHAEREADSLVRHRLLGEIISANPFEVPKSWVRQRMNANCVSQRMTSSTPAGAAPVQSGPASRNVPSPLPVVRLPT